MFRLVFFFFNDTATTEIYTLSLHDALPTSAGSFQVAACSRPAGRSQDSTCSWRADVPLRLMMSGLETPKQDFAPRCTNCFSWDGRLRRDFAAPLGFG